jgi:transcription initiation factor TFIID subunit 12
MNQAAQNYSGAVTQQSMAAQAAQAAQAANSHAHPHALSRGESGTRNVNMQIPKNLNVPPPEPVAMGPARPTLTAAGSHGSMGPIGQPAIQRLPGYVLEGEGQRVLSKKMLDTLVRQVTGGGDTEGLTPDAEEVRKHIPNLPFTLFHPHL